MTRRTQWEPLCPDDPTPGDPDQVTQAGRHYQNVADEIDAQVKRLKEIADGKDDLQGDYVSTLVDSSKKLAKDLGKASGRYRDVGSALIGWGPMLTGFQHEADLLWTRADNAQSAVSSTQPIVGASDPSTPPTAEQVSADKKRASDHTDALRTASGVQNDLDDLRRRRDNEANSVAHQITDSSQDGMKDSWWDNFKDWMDKNAGWIATVSKVLGYVALAAMVISLFVPGLDIVAAIALGAQAASLLGHTALAASGNGSWVDVGMDVVSLATMGTGKFLTTGFKIGSKAAGGAVDAAATGTRAAAAAESGRVAAAATKTAARAEAAAIKEGLNGARSLKDPAVRAAKAQLQNIARDTPGAMNAARRTAAAAYRNLPEAVPTLGQRVLAGGEDKLAAAAADVARSVRDFPDSARVAAAAARAARPIAAATAAYSTSAGIDVVSGLSDAVPIPGLSQLDDKLTRAIGSTW